MKILTESVWPQAKAALLEGLAGNRRHTLSVTLENTRKVLLNESTLASSNLASINKVVLPLLRRVLPTTIANELVAVQPMEGPVGQINTMRIIYGDTSAGVVAGQEALSPFDIAAAYSGNKNPASPAAAPTASLEFVGGNSVTFQIVKDTVTAESRRLRATWTVEAAQDLQSQYGEDAESILMETVAAQIVSEIDQEILFRLRNLVGVPSLTYDQTALSGNPTSVVDEHAVLTVLINRQSDRIAQRTRRAGANWIVVSPAVRTILDSARASALVRTTEGTFEDPSNVKFVGTLNNRYRVYVDTYANDTQMVLVGLKQSDQEAALYYCPYIPLMATPPVPNFANPFQQTVGFMTRYGVKTLTNVASSFGNAADYVAGIAVVNLSFF
jgi:hypothetical protein